MYSGYLAFAGTEIVNNVRAAVYAAQMGITTVNCGGCDTLPRAVYDKPYSSPDQDDAPWFDPAEPASKDLAGFVGLDITGVSRTVATRTAVPLTIDGAALHPLRRPQKEVQVKVLVIAKTDCALSYGYSWLASALRGSLCSNGCEGDNLCFFTCCPTCPPPPEDPDATDTCGDPNWRTMINAGLLAMDEPTDIRKIPGGYIAQLTYTITVGNPFVYRESVLMARGPGDAEQLPNYEDPGVPPDCFEAADCLRSDDCPPPNAPILPPLPVDACYPTGPFTASRAVFTLRSEAVPLWAEKIPYVVVRAGAGELRRLTIRWYGNATGVDCKTAIDPCAACAEINIAMLPAGSTLTIDGRTETASVDCSGGPGLATAEPQLYARGGAPFVWPVFPCADGSCLEVIAEAASISPDTEIDISYIVREDAA